MDKKTTMIIFDENSTETKRVFDDNWETESRVITQTATEENLINIEVADTGVNSVYIGDQNERLQRVETNGGICFSSATFIEITKVMSISSTSNLEQNIDDTDKIGSSVITRVNANKIKRLIRLGIHF